MPRPPFVIASKSACDIVQMKMNVNAESGRGGHAISVSTIEARIAKQIECVKPRCPNMLA
jgi:hypothetical protein